MKSVGRLRVLAVLALAWAGCSRRDADTQTHSAQQLRDSLGPTAVHRPVTRLDSARVPAELRTLIHLAERWGIGDDVVRNDLVAQSSETEREELRRAVPPHAVRITAWLDSFGSNPMTAEAAAFMYMQLALEELPRPAQAR